METVTRPERSGLQRLSLPEAETPSKLRHWWGRFILIELDSVYCGHLEPVDHAELATERRDRRNRRTWLRFRLNGVDLPAIPEEPKDILERTPFQRQCEAIVLDLVRRGGGHKAFDEGRLEIDGRTIAILVGGLSGLAYEFKRWRDKGFPELAASAVRPVVAECGC